MKDEGFGSPADVLSVPPSSSVAGIFPICKMFIVAGRFLPVLQPSVMLISSLALID